MQFTRTRDVKAPNRGTPESAGLDFYIPNDYGELTLMPGESANIPSGIKMIIPSDYAGVFFNKSGVALKGIQVGACVIDSDYRGEIHLNVHNVSNQAVSFKPGQKLVQMLILPIQLFDLIEVDTLGFDQWGGTTIRGSGGFGSTGEF